MWATARSVEQGESLYIHAYATWSEQKWLFDMHIINPGEPPSFGRDVPHLYMPMSAIFTPYTPAESSWREITRARDVQDLRRATKEIRAKRAMLPQRRHKALRIIVRT